MKMDNRFMKEFVLEIMDKVLKNIVFMFNGKYFYQIKGIVMVLIYVILCLGQLEEILYKKINEEFGEEFSQILKKN